MLTKDGVDSMLVRFLMVIALAKRTMLFADAGPERQQQADIINFAFGNAEMSAERSGRGRIRP